MGAAHEGAGQAEQGVGGRLPHRQGRDLCQDLGVLEEQQSKLQCHQGRNLCQDQGILEGQEGTLQGVVVVGLGWGHTSSVVSKLWKSSQKKQRRQHSGSPSLAQLSRL